MFYGLHTTRKSERDMLMAQEGVLTMIDPHDFHYSDQNKTMVYEEGTGKVYEHSIDNFLKLCKDLENPLYDPTTSDYFKMWEYKGAEIYTRLRRLRPLIKDIKENGIKNPVHCEVTGERLDGSYRTKIAIYLGIKEVPAIVHRFKWQDIDEDFIERKLKVREASSGKDYYEFSYGYKDWKNIQKGGQVYKENADRADFIVGLIEGKSVLDLGCNEGYIGIQAARKGLKVEGVDLDWNHISYLNKLIFEFVDKKDLPIEFYRERIEDCTRTADTILMLNVLYHIPKDRQEEILKRYKGKQIIFQCNLRKAHVREQYYTSHPDDLIALLTKLGFSYKKIEWKDKPIIIANGK